MKQADEQREAFEAWADTQSGGRLRSSSSGGYDYPLGRLMWAAWQAALAASLPPAAVQAGTKRHKLCGTCMTPSICVDDGCGRPAAAAVCPVPQANGYCEHCFNSFGERVNLCDMGEAMLANANEGTLTAGKQGGDEQFVRKSPASGDYQPVTERWAATHIVAPIDGVAAVVPAQPLTVWFGPMPESNGRTNWTAILHRGDKSEGHTIDRSQYPGRVRYAADRVRWLLGELEKKPFILDYDGDERTPCHLCGGSGEKDGKPCWGLNFDGTVHDAASGVPGDAK